MTLLALDVVQQAGNMRDADPARQMTSRGAGGPALDVGQGARVQGDFGGVQHAVAEVVLQTVRHLLPQPDDQWVGFKNRPRGVQRAGLIAVKINRREPDSDPARPLTQLRVKGQRIGHCRLEERGDRTDVPISAE